jgi:putative PIN family toxin of toxin-antitoxin system
VRLVLDTNATISGLLWQGTPGKLIDAAQAKTVSLYTSAPLLAELQGVLARAKFAKQLQARALTTVAVFDGYAALAVIVTPASIASAVEIDPTDDAVLACALAARADLIVSGDRDLLQLKHYQHIPIVTPTEALTRLPRK